MEVWGSYTLKLLRRNEITKGVNVVKQRRQGLSVLCFFNIMKSSKHDGRKERRKKGKTEEERKEERRKAKRRKVGGKKERWRKERREKEERRK